MPEVALGFPRTFVEFTDPDDKDQVFRCDLTASQRLQLEAKLGQIIDHSEDQVMFVDLGPTDGRSHSIASVGRPTPSSEPRGVSRPSGSLGVSACAGGGAAGCAPSGAGATTSTATRQTADR